MFQRTEGVVLHNQRYSDADLIVTYLTKDFGILKALAKSPRKIKSRFGSSLEPLTVARIGIFGKEQKSLPRLVQSDIIKNNQSLRDDMELFIALSECIRLILYLFPERQKEKDLYQVFINTLESLTLESQPKRQCLALKVKILALSGYGPELSRCARCGGQSNKFYLSEGGVICHKCSENEGPYFRINGRTKSLYDILIRAKPEVLKRMKVPEEVWFNLEKLIQSHINYNIPIGEKKWRKDLNRKPLSA